MGTLLNYGKSVNSTMFFFLYTRADSAKTQDKSRAITQLINYYDTHQDSTVCLHRSYMCLNIHSDASYLSKHKYRNCAGGYFYIGYITSDPSIPPLPDFVLPPMNGSIHILYSIIIIVISSATKSELGDSFLIAKRRP